MTRCRWVTARKAEGFPTRWRARSPRSAARASTDWQAAEAAGPNEVKLSEAVLVEAIRAIHDEFDGTYGEPRITEELARRGWKAVFGDDVLAAAILDPLLHHCEVVSINGPSYRLKDHLPITKGGGPLQ